MKNIDFIGKNVVITGGSSGLGRALVSQFIHQGAKVAAIARGQEGLDQLTAQYPQVISVQGDVSKAKEIHPMAGEIHSRLGDVDILVNAASALGPTPLRLLLDTECEDFAQVFETNVLGPFRLSKVLIPSMLLKQRGVIVNISSDAAVNAYPTWGAYGVSKAALAHMSRIFQQELKDKGVRFLSIDPGDMNTPMHFAAVPDAHPAELKDPADSAAEIIEQIKEAL